ncbi:MAG: sulfatase [Planctomycetota bacterium]
MTFPPVVVVAIDTLAARHLGIYGYERETAPSIAEFAAESVVFENCTSNATWTVPSFMALFSGMYPRAHELPPDPAHAGAVQQWEQRAIAPNRWTIAEALRSAGYRTAGFVDNTWLSARLGFSQGFDVWDDSAGFVPLADRSGGIEHTTRLALDWLDARRDERPWFLFVHAFDVHGPYVASLEARARFEPDARRDEQLLAGGVNQAFGIVHEYVARGVFPEGDLPETVSSERLRADYDGGIAELDAKLGAFFDDLRARRVFEEAIVVLLADHGETVGESDLLFGHGVLDPLVTHVPLIVHLPHGRGTGLRVTTPVQLVDVYPTVLELVGLPHERSFLSGRSLAGAFRPGYELEELPQFSFGGLIENQRSVRLGRWCLHWSRPLDGPLAARLTHPRMPREDVVAAFPHLARRGMTKAVDDELLADPGREALERFASERLPEVLIELYDLEADPQERRDVASEHPEVVAQLMELIERNREEVRVLRDLAVRPRELPSLSDEALEILRGLGYADEAEAQD